jgi:murein DD-endopeptidase MepM/ murein hydrolase activator NlpD
MQSTRKSLFVTVFFLALLLAGPLQPSMSQAGALQQTPTIYYTALGDSIASGHGLPGEGTTCRVSSLSYPVKAAGILGEKFGQELLPLNLACSGATVGLQNDEDNDNDLLDRMPRAEDDLSSLPANSPILVTISIGANNFLGSDVVSKASELSREAYSDYVDSTLADLEQALAPQIGQLLAHPNVSVLMVTYPSPVPTHYQHVCSDLSSHAPACLGDLSGDPWRDPMVVPLLPPITTLTPLMTEQLFIRLDYFISRLNQVVGHDVYQEYLSTGRVGTTEGLRDAFSGHECFTPDPWFQCRAELVFGKKPGDKKVDVLIDPVHPNAAGAQAIAEQVAIYAEPLLRSAIEHLNPSQTPTQAPPAGVPDPVTGGEGLHLPWEAGSVWQITNGNGTGEHADAANQYGFDAVPVAGRSTNQVTAIAAGQVVGFQNDIPDTALFSVPHAGNCMLIRHDDGTTSIYAHLAAGSIPGELLHDGATVRGGMVIGSVGNSGYSSGVHLHWSLLSEGHMYDDAGYRTCAGTSIPSKYADNDAELIEDGGVPRTGRYYASTNDGSSAVQEPVSPPIGSSTDCNDAGIPQITNGLTYSPANPDTATQVEFSFTITNTSGCGTFQPEVLAIGGRDPNSEVSDPLQIRDFTLGPGESREISQTTVLDIPGTHEFFMVFLRAGGGWNEIPDTSGVSQHIYINVTEAADGGADFPGDGVEAPSDSTEVAPTPAQDADIASMDIGATGPNGHEIGAQFTVTTGDGDVLGSCTLEGQGDEPYELGCRVDVPRNTTVVVTLDESTITPGYTPVENPLYFDTSGDPGAASSWGVTFQLEPQGNTPGNGPAIEPGGDSDAVDIALITREPEGGDLLTGACYVVGQSNEGCDENGDGQVTFADIPFGTYTVHQTQTPAGYPAINDYEIIVEGIGYMEGPSFGVPLGFIVRQAPEQNAPDSRNVSVVFLDMVTHERVTSGACVELMGASNVGCDRDLIDGQADFLDVPAGGPYELSFSNLPDGYEAATVGGPLAVTIDAGPNDPSNVMVFVLLAGSNGAQNPTSSGTGSDSGEATMLMTFRGCPEGFDPNTGNFAADCTIPLDAPDASTIVWGGDGQGGMEITGLDRQNNGAYIYNAGPETMNLVLSGMAPVVRDAYEVVGADSVNGDAYTFNLANGETREVFIYYYYSTGSGSSESVDTSGSTAGGSTQATVLLTFRACPEGFAPDVDDPFVDCTIPLDAPDASVVGVWGEPSSLVPITSLERQYNGEYVYYLNSSTGYLELRSLEPVVRDDFLVYGVDDQDGSSYVTLLDNGETREIFVFYYYA